MRTLAARNFRGPFARWPRVSDAVLAAILFSLAVTVTEGPRDSLVTRPVTDLPIAVVLVIAAAATAMWLRRRAPLMVLGVTVVGWAVLVPTGEYDLGLIVVVVLYSVGRYVAELRPGLIGVAAVAGVLVVEGLVRSTAWGEIWFGISVMYLI